MILAALALAAQPPAQPPATPVPLPVYRPGDSFVFSDGRVERVIRVNKDKIVWSALSGSPYTRSRNFVVPVEFWRLRGGFGRRNIFGSAASLWPYARPKSARFRAVTETKVKFNAPLKRSVTLWTCKTLRPRTVKLSFGQFATVPFHCDRYSATNMRLLERLEWDYAPELNHYARRSSIDYLRGTRRTIDLVAMLSGPAATRRRLAALSRAARRGERPVPAD